MFAKKKMTPKPRSANEINQEYNQQASLAGHKMSMIQQFEKEILDHAHRMEQLRKEVAAMPNPQPTPSAEATQQKTPESTL